MLLRAEAVAKHFGGIRAVDDVTFAVAPGELVGLIGPNGSGKTTLINVMSGGFAPDAGRIFVDDVPMGGKPAHVFAHHGVGRTFQIPRLFGRMTVLENMIAPALTRKHAGSRAAIDRRAFEVLDFLSLTALAECDARTLSGGQQKLLELGRCLMLEPRLILLDEPFAGVHPNLLEQLLARIRELNEQGFTIIVVDHNLDAVRGLVKRLIVMARGTQIADGDPEAVLRHAHVVDAYTGASS
ncbi:MAG: ABC transporter ATP-binding protein [Vulcanimicrobiaceae bacterium]